MQIKQFELSEKNQLLAFLREAYAENPRMWNERFWDWHFLENPYIETDNLPIWVVKNGAEIVGQLGAIPVRLKVGEAVENAIWILDFIVSEKYRGQGLGKKLVAAAEAFCPLGLGVNTNEQTAPQLLQKLGWRIIGKIPRYNKILFPGEALREISRFKPLRAVSNAVFAPFRPGKIKDFLGKNNLRLVETFDSSFDELWRESAADYSCGVAREAAILKWQYRDQPDKKFDVLGFYENEILRGYAVLFFRKSDERGALPKAAITDLCYDSANPTETIDALLRGALQIALERRAGTLVTDVIDDLIAERLIFFGFHRVKNPLQLMVKTPTAQDVLYDASRWFLTRGDSDISIFESPNL
ncbi:MAG: GNAT family N-acetyltransferase [Pyrinomonadaceae bacterium]|nr:GNAT family N-acetyltransferase [Pyrinomonadaceae bacterium]